MPIASDKPAVVAPPETVSIEREFEYPAPIRYVEVPDPPETDKLAELFIAVRPYNSRIQSVYFVVSQIMRSGANPGPGVAVGVRPSLANASLLSFR